MSHKDGATRINVSSTGDTRRAVEIRKDNYGSVGTIAFAISRPMATRTASWSGSAFKDTIKNLASKIKSGDLVHSKAPSYDDSENMDLTISASRHKSSYHTKIGWSSIGQPAYGWYWDNRWKISN